MLNNILQNTKTILTIDTYINICHDRCIPTGYIIVKISCVKKRELEVYDIEID